jgi:hypothetical protein
MKSAGVTEIGTGAGAVAVNNAADVARQSTSEFRLNVADCYGQTLALARLSSHFPATTPANAGLWPCNAG